MMFSMITKSEQYLPKAFPLRMDPHAKDLINQLLKPNPTMRLGALRDGMQGIWNHPFFANCDQSAIERAALVPPYSPQLDNPLAVGHFGEYEEPETVPYTGRYDFSGF